MEEAAGAEYRAFLAAHGELLQQLVELDWTRREARVRMIAVYPGIDHALLDQALSDLGWASERRSEDPISRVVVASSMWLAVNELFDLGEDPVYAVTLLDDMIFQDMSAFMDLHGIGEERAASILRRLAASMKYLADYPLTSVTREEYRDFLDHLPDYLAELSAKREGHWPVSDLVFQDHIGEGSWSRALLSVSMSPEHRYAPDGTDRVPEYTEARFRSAMADFFTFCIRTDRKPQALLYGRWASSGARGRVPRPNLATVRHHFGSWSAALIHGRELINDNAPGQGDPRYEEHWVGPWQPFADVDAASGQAPSARDRGRDAAASAGAAARDPQHWTERGIGVVEHVIETATADETAWEDLTAEIAQALADLPWHHFLTVEYETGNGLNESPFAQAFTGPGGVDVTVVSEQFLPAIVWPIDDEYLTETGWTAPSESHPQWRQHRLAPERAAGVLVQGLRYGRDCTDPYKFRWGSGSFSREDPVTDAAGSPRV